MLCLLPCFFPPVCLMVKTILSNVKGGTSSSVVPMSDYNRNLVIFNFHD